MTPLSLRAAALAIVMAAATLSLSAAAEWPVGYGDNLIDVVSSPSEDASNLLELVKIVVNS
jgi:hypothetical protein